MTHQEHADTAATIIAKTAPPASVSIAHLLGMPVSELVLWATLFYTILMIAHKVYQFYYDIKRNQ
jgi:hypothetical protein